MTFSSVPHLFDLGAQGFFFLNVRVYILLSSWTKSELFMFFSRMFFQHKGLKKSPSPQTTRPGRLYVLKWIPSHMSVLVIIKSGIYTNTQTLIYANGNPQFILIKVSLARALPNYRTTCFENIHLKCDKKTEQRM